jgi:hypothetical protein
MTVVVVVSAKGSPGVSLTTWGITHCWPRGAIGVEVDPSGGSWALTHGLTTDPGLMDLAAEQGLITEGVLERCSTAIGASKRLICAPRESLLVRRALEWMEDRLLAWPEPFDVIADVGRLDPSSNHPLVSRADAIVVCTHTSAAGLGATAALLASLDRHIKVGAIVRIVTIGSDPYGPAEAMDALKELADPRLSLGFGAQLPNDPRLAALLVQGGRKASKICSAWYGALSVELATATAHRSVIVPPHETLAAVGGAR